MRSELSRVWIRAASLQDAEAEATRSFPFETGGVLIGYVATETDCVVMDVIGPGPGAIHKRWSFYPDHDWQCAQLDRIYSVSGGVAVYLGDWHTHPKGSRRMSWTDRRTLRRLQGGCSHITQPLMLIGAGTPNSWLWGCYCYCTARIFGQFVGSRTLTLKAF